SLGVVLYEMLTGRLPFSGEPEQAVTFQIVHERPEPITALRTGVPMELERIVSKCFEKKPSDRYQHVDELVVDLRKLKRAPTPKPKKNLIKYAVVALVVVIVGVTMWKSLWQHGAVSPTEDLAVAVVDFRDLGTPDDATASAGITGLVQVGLVESSPCRVVSPQYLYDLRRRLFGAGRGPIEEDQALEVARKSGATMLLSGQMVTLSVNPYITWQLVDTRNGKSLGARRVEGENLAMLADQIIAGVLPLLASECGVEEPTLPPSVSTLTTASPQAYRHYVAGVLAREEVREEEAIRELEHAVRLDSTFALALFELARATPFKVASDRARSFAERAWELRTRLGLKDRLRLDAYRQRLDWRIQDALSTYREMLSRWPDDREVLGDLSALLSWYWYSNEAIQVAERGLALYPDDLGFGSRYGQALASMGRLEEALEWSQVYIKRHPGTANAWDERGLRFLSLGLPDSAETAFRQALKIGPGFPESMGYSAYCRGNLDRAIEIFERILRESDLSPEERIRLIIPTGGWPGLAQLHAETGRFSKALELFEEARQDVSGLDSEISLDTSRNRLLLRMGRAQEVLGWAEALAKRSKTRFTRREVIRARARALVALESLEAARSAVTELLPLEKQYGGLVRFLVRKVTADIALAEGNPKKALASLNEMRRQGVPTGGLHDIEWREAMARAHQLAGRSDEAARVHKELLRIYGGHALSHYELGKIYEEMGRPADAVSAFTKFLEMWSEADEGLPQVADAQQRLNALGGGEAK
ncbi:MAG: tetratricopeptide repeat protein, partial [Candidatus Krumholzibacteria bacterium]